MMSLWHIERRICQRGPKENRIEVRALRIRTIATNTFDSQAYPRAHYVQMGRFVSRGSKTETGADVPHILHIPLRNPPLFQ